MIEVFIENLVLEGIHGVTAKEKKRKQPFRIDITVELKSSHKVREDGIESAVDYRQMKEIATTVVTKESHDLLETMGNHIAQRIFQDPRIHSVSVSVRKLTIWQSGVPGITVTLRRFGAR